eukprot:scaffold128477_cov69-Phaeocystis_antarctica.AAC.1
MLVGLSWSGGGAALPRLAQDECCGEAVLARHAQREGRCPHACVCGALEHDRLRVGAAHAQQHLNVRGVREARSEECAVRAVAAEVQASVGPPRRADWHTPLLVQGEQHGICACAPAATAIGQRRTHEHFDYCICRYQCNGKTLPQRLYCIGIHGVNAKRP